jgi:hypothetical protein
MQDLFMVPTEATLPPLCKYTISEAIRFDVLCLMDIRIVAVVVAESAAVLVANDLQSSSSHICLVINEINFAQERERRGIVLECRRNAETLMLCYTLSEVI